MWLVRDTSKLKHFVVTVDAFLQAFTSVYDVNLIMYLRVKLNFNVMYNEYFNYVILIIP